MNLASTVRRNDWLIESWSETGTVEECRNDFPDWHADVLAVNGNLNLTHLCAELVTWN